MTNEELVYLHQQGDKQALEKLLEKNTGIVNKIVNKYYVEGTNSIDREDLFQEGMIGLITAANKYDLNNPKKAQFITYAVHWINAKINRFINTRCTNEETSLNIPIGDSENRELVDYIEGVDYSFENIEEKIYRQQLRKELDEVMIECNSLKEREILKLHYGWDSNKCLTLEEIGDIFNVTGSMIRNHESSAMRKIRKSQWARNKAKELYSHKKVNCIDNIPGAINSISFAQRYLLEMI